MHLDSEWSRVDFRDQLPCFDWRVEIRVDGNNWTRVVGTYLHHDHGIDGAGRCNGTDDRTAINLRRDVSRLLLAFRYPPERHPCGDQQQGCDRPQPFDTRTHASVWLD